MKVVIFGASGQTGKCLTPLLDQHELVTPASQDVNFTRRGDIAAFLHDAAADYVINLAAYTAVDKAESELDLAIAINGDAVGEMAAACNARSTPLLHVSTDFVFDGTHSSPLHPAAPCAPLGAYGQSKYLGEQAILATGANSVILRTAWVYSNHGANFMLSMLRLMNERKELNIVADQIGTPTSAYSLARTIREFMSRSLQGIYHWTDAGAASWYDFAVAIYEEASVRNLVPAGVKINPIPCSQYPTPAKRPAYSVLDKSSTYVDLDMDRIHWRQELREVLDLLV